MQFLDQICLVEIEKKSQNQFKALLYDRSSLFELRIAKPKRLPNLFIREKKISGHFHDTNEKNDLSWSGFNFHLKRIKLLFLLNSFFSHVFMLNWTVLVAESERINKTKQDRRKKDVSTLNSEKNI